MIKYKRGGRHIILNLFEYHGSTFPYTIIIALPCAIISAVLQSIYPDGTLRVAVLGSADVGGIMSEAQTWSGFSFLVGFLIVFRTSQAYGRFWEGCTASHQMRAEWFDACSSLISFCKASCAPPEVVSHFKSLLVCLTSMLHAQALAALESGDKNDDGDMFDLLAWNYKLIDPGAVDERSLETIKRCENRVELLFEWIQQLVVENIETGVLVIPPPILSRSFQELANGMVAFHDAMKISHIPFPFPYAQSCDCLLVFHWILVPFITSQWVTSPMWAAIFTFIQVFILWSLNLIAIQIDNPFGRDHNDIDAKGMQEEINKHLSLLLEPSTERTPTLVRPLHGVGRNRYLVDRVPSRNSFVDLFKEDEEVESESGQGVLGSPNVMGKRRTSSPRGSMSNWFGGFGISSPITMSVQSSLPALRRKSDARENQKDRDSGSAASVFTNASGAYSPGSPMMHQEYSTETGLRLQTPSQRFPMGMGSESLRIESKPAAASFALESLAKNMQNAVRPADEESVGCASPDDGSGHGLQDTLSNQSIPMGETDTMQRSGEVHTARSRVTVVVDPAPHIMAPPPPEQRQGATSASSSRAVAKRPPKPVVHICPACDRDLPCQRGTNAAPAQGECSQCGRYVLTLGEHPCRHCNKAFCRDCIRQTQNARKGFSVI